MPYLGLLHPEPLPLQQSTADPYPTGDTQTQLCLSLCGVSGFWCTQGLFEPSECLWGVWGLILNVIFPLLPYCWGTSLALGHGVSSHSRSTAMQPPQYCIESWNVRSMNQGKLEVVKQEMARVNIDLLGISELKWTGM